MGEQRATRESMVSNQVDDIYFVTDNHLPITDNIVCLRSSCADKLIYVHNNALGYNKCKFNSTLEAALMFKSKSINGEITSAC